MSNLIHVLITLTQLIGVVGGPNCETTYRNGDRIAWVATLFGARVAGGTPVPDGAETTEARFVAAEELASMTLREDTMRFLKAEREGISGAYFQPPSWRPA